MLSYMSVNVSGKQRTLTIVQCCAWACIGGFGVCSQNRHESAPGPHAVQARVSTGAGIWKSSRVARYLMTLRSPCTKCRTDGTDSSTQLPGHSIRTPETLTVCCLSCCAKLTDTVCVFLWGQCVDGRLDTSLYGWRPVAGRFHRRHDCKHT